MSSRVLSFQPQSNSLLYSNIHLFTSFFVLRLSKCCTVICQLTTDITFLLFCLLNNHHLNLQLWIREKDQKARENHLSCTNPYFLLDKNLLQSRLDSSLHQKLPTSSNILGFSRKNKQNEECSINYFKHWNFVYLENYWKLTFCFCVI